MTAAVIPLADAALRRGRRCRLAAAIAYVNGAPLAGDRWRERASEWLSKAYDLAPCDWAPPTE